MKTLAGLVFAPVALATLGMMPAVSLDASNSTGAYCGVGYTYCGYILKEQKSKLVVFFLVFFFFFLKLLPRLCSPSFHKCMYILKPKPAQILTRPPSSRRTAPGGTATRQRAPRRQTHYRRCSCAYPRRRFPRGICRIPSHTRGPSRLNCSALAAGTPLEVERTSASILMETILDGAARRA